MREAVMVSAGRTGNLPPAARGEDGQLDRNALPTIHVLFIVENQGVPNDTRVWEEAKVAKSWGCDVSIISRRDEGATKARERIEDIDLYRHPSSVRNHLLRYACAFFWEFVLACRVYFGKPFHVIHVASPPDTLFFIGFIFRILGVKFIVDVHDLSPELFLAKFKAPGSLTYRLLLFLERRSAKLADAVIVTNETYSKKLCERHGLSPENVFVVRNDAKAVGLGVPGERDNVKAFDGKCVLLYLGHINRQDGIDFLIRALHVLIHEFDERGFVCVVVGKGESVPGAKHLVKELGLSSFVDFKGYEYDRDRVNCYLKLGDIGVEPAPDNPLNRCSTFVKVLELMGAGKPIVAFDLPETRVSAGDSALYAASEDVRGFAAALKRLIDSPDLRQKMGRIGQDRVQNQLNWNYSALRLRDAYDSVFGPKST
jgi:glycosyltransferase involved in cell wall biosynthesis